LFSLNRRNRAFQGEIYEFVAPENLISCWNAASEMAFSLIGPSKVRFLQFTD